MAVTIGELARRTGANAETIRYYEKIGLLRRPARTGGNYRSYGEAEQRRLVFILRSRELGFKIDKVRALLELADDAGRSCEAVDNLSRERLEEIDRKIADLQALRQELARLLVQCQHGTVAECRIIEALAPS